MVNNFVSILPNKHIADIYYQLKKVTSKIQKTASSIGLLSQCVYYNVTPMFAKVRGSFPMISNSLRMSNIQQLKTKNRKIHKLKPKE